MKYRLMGDHINMADEITEIPLTFDQRLDLKRAEYSKAFRIEDLNDANDRSNLDMMLKTELMVDDIQAKIKNLMDDDVIENVAAIKKLSDLLKDARDTVLAIQRTLAIDRRTRKSEETASVADYIRALKRDAREFMDQRIIKVWCMDCKVMVGRIFPVHDHTAFSCTFECSQCHKLVRARREARDVLFDVRDRKWRTKYPAEIVQPKKFTRIESIDEGDELVLDGDPQLNVDQAEALEQHIVHDDLELGEDDVDTAIGE